VPATHSTESRSSNPIRRAARICRHPKKVRRRALRTRIAIAVAVLAAVAVPAFAFAAGAQHFEAYMSNALEAPKSADKATGTAKITITGNKVCWKFLNVKGATGAF